jgi:hypothetical protein
LSRIFHQTSGAKGEPIIVLKPKRIIPSLKRKKEAHPSSPSLHIQQRKKKESDMKKAINRPKGPNVLTAKAKKKRKPKKQQPPKTQRKRLVLLVSLDYQLPRTFEEESEERSFPPVPFRVIVNVAPHPNEPKDIRYNAPFSSKTRKDPAPLPAPLIKKKVGKKCKRGAGDQEGRKDEPIPIPKKNKRGI